MEQETAADMAPLRSQIRMLAAATLRVKHRGAPSFDQPEQMSSLAHKQIEQLMPRLDDTTKSAPTLMVVPWQGNRDKKNHDVTTVSNEWKHLK